jgi:hypothetical protein
MTLQAEAPRINKSRGPRRGGRIIVYSWRVPAWWETASPLLSSDVNPEIAIAFRSPCSDVFSFSAAVGVLLALFVVLTRRHGRS